MNKVSTFLINLLRFTILIFIVILIRTSIISLVGLNSNSFFDVFFVFEIGSVLIGTITIFSKIRHKYKIAFLLIIALLLRFIWIMSIDSQPVSDYQIMYEYAHSILNGDMSGLRGYGYLARFPHLIPMAFYISAMIKLFPIYNLFAMKILNVLYGIFSIYLLHKLSDHFIKSEKNKLFIMLIAAIFPPFVSYTSVLATENIAIPFYLLTMIVFYNACENGRTNLFIISGVLLAVSNLFRGIAIVFLIAFTIFLILCVKGKRFKNITCVIFGYAIVTAVISTSLLSIGVIERPLWRGAEPSTVTLLLKGSNFDSYGMWNQEDAIFIEENLKSDTLYEKCLDKVKERILSKSPKELFTFYFYKVTNQWFMGDCAGTYWAYSTVDSGIKSNLPYSFQFLYTIILVFAFFGVFKKCKQKDELLNIVLIGFILLFMIIETQPRYSYVVSWMFVLFASKGIEVILDFIAKQQDFRSTIMGYLRR